MSQLKKNSSYMIVHFV